ncbi:hypothetical protein [Herbaspirillum rubrisubalbicans]|uniref:hypothetical protein n=1 Tax=Herbaspirillum rubrisubalbicans TaxID=80842 RepID=UPI00209E62DB|nr:hypothetical protein [Herbaspirillum rubrisubalbicans]
MATLGLGRSQPIRQCLGGADVGNGIHQALNFPVQLLAPAGRCHALGHTVALALCQDGQHLASQLFLCGRGEQLIAQGLQQVLVRGLPLEVNALADRWPAILSVGAAVQPGIDGHNGPATIRAGHQAAKQGPYRRPLFAARQPAIDPLAHGLPQIFIDDA